ncbi:endonuclease/exonuclease/phosphatase family protein [Agromyces aerolatus]|uniref:endonuclease/exonuclease/phosphatase family protein n=1 Tax=Agromyces sp. LY-1074 TaxID=3074080 RepID=UPI00285BC67D|nr:MULTISPECIES: endonuclease/exonuclease/phosphatase family protein [unclassified Agromyces]MDR5701937.1 endonuclease/exonuclease/phosphatase family protein [Agromyces sp. LY-1074]MDR5708164.1 endonuclease/exonuclease/phosphatase family protein [Agromyces sp. LY-1358]
MRFVTWNVLWRFEPDWRARERGILTTLDRLAPDVIGLQECWGTDDDTQAHVVARHLDLHAAFAAPSLPPEPVPPEQDDQAGVRMGVGLVSRWPIRVLARHELPVSHRQVAPVALEAELGVPDASVRVLVAALEWEPAYADDQLAQTTRLAELLAPATPSAPAVLLADLNCDPGQREFAPLAAVADDTWSLGDGATDAVTLSRAVPFAPLEATKQLDRRVDHVLVAPRGVAEVGAVRIVTATVDGRYPSDHFPVAVDLDVPRAGHPSPVIHRPY